jgi:para-nitrobenzyl esterase
MQLRLRLFAGLSALVSLWMGDESAWAAAVSVNTSSGPVQGVEQEGVLEFRGIRYAEPPVGVLRWAAPRRPDPRRASQDDRVAVSCPQNAASVFARPSEQEDCLVLNVFVPDRGAPGRAGAATGWPVLVWLHGGGLFSGSGADYDGSRLARDGRVIVVTVNYRLGALGFLTDPTVLRESHGVANFGLLDQQFALRWVKRNIGAFGGRASVVTLAGQSSGATSVVAHLLAPGSAGLFQRAVIQSGTRFVPLAPQRARSSSESFVAAVGCQEDTLRCLRGLAVQTILEHQQDLVAATAGSFFVLDRVTGSVPPREAFGTGRFHRMPVVSGLTADEQAYFLPEASTGQPLTAAEYDHWAHLTGGSRAQEITARYPVSRYASPSLAEIAAAQDSKRCIVLAVERQLSRFVPVYAYEFADRGAPSYFPERSYPMRAYHTAELQYLFPLFHGARGTGHALDAAQQSLAQRMVGWWSTFARTGAPGTQDAPWPAFREAGNSVLVIAADEGSPRDDVEGSPRDDVEGSSTNVCAFWESLGMQ